MRLHTKLFLAAGVCLLVCLFQVNQLASLAREADVLSAEIQEIENPISGTNIRQGIQAFIEGFVFGSTGQGDPFRVFDKVDARDRDLRSRISAWQSKYRTAIILRNISGFAIFAFAISGFIVMRATQTPPSSIPNRRSDGPPVAIEVVITVHNPEKNGALQEFRVTSREVVAKGGAILIGRSQEFADIVIENTSMSKAHAAISYTGSSFYLKDHGSSNGTFINGSRLNPGTVRRLQNNDRILLGEVSLEWRS